MAKGEMTREELLEIAEKEGLVMPHIHDSWIMDRPDGVKVLILEIQSGFMPWNSCAVAGLRIKPGVSALDFAEAALSWAQSIHDHAIQEEARISGRTTTTLHRTRFETVEGEES